MSYSLTFLPEQDRILLWFRSQEDEAPDPVLLTRRLTRVLGDFLRKALEKTSGVPDHLGEADLSEYMQFFHDREIESAPVQWNADRPAPDAGEAQDRLVTQIDTKNSDTLLALSCFNGNTFLVRLTLDWNSVHRLLHSLAQMAQVADWGLDEELTWKDPRKTGWGAPDPSQIN